MRKKLLDLFFTFPYSLDRTFRWLDLRINRTEGTFLHTRLRLVRGYSSLALWLPVLVLPVLAYGPLVLDRWRGGIVALLLLATLVVHLLCCRLVHGRALAWAQWLAVALFSLAVYLLAKADARQADPEPYRHLLLAFAPLVITLGVPANRAWADWLFAGKRSDYRRIFAAELHRTQLFLHPTRAPRELFRVLRAYVLVPLWSLLLLLVFPALAVLVAERDALWPLFSVTLLANWALLAAIHYNDRLTALRDLLDQTFAVGGLRIVTLVVVLLAAARLANLSYVTTVLDQVSRWIVVALVGTAYLVFWLYDYWTQRALSEVLLGLLHQNADHPTQVPYLPADQRAAWVQLHGGGRFLVLREGADTASPAAFQAYPPLEVFAEIAGQLRGRALGERTPRLWRLARRAEYELETLEQRARVYRAMPGLLVVCFLVAAGHRLYTLDQAPGLLLSTSQERSGSAAAGFDLAGTLRRAAGERDPLLLVAASGGGTRAALYTYAVLRALAQRDLLDRVVLLSGVSGGSLGIAWFAAHRGELLEPEAPAWLAYRCAMAEPYVSDVLAGTGEWRFWEGARLGQLLTEAFERRFHGAWSRRCGEKPALGAHPIVTTLGGAAGAPAPGVGLIFNAALAGSYDGSTAEGRACLRERGRLARCATALAAGSRLVFTNVTAFAPEGVRTRAPGWPRDLEFVVLRSGRIPLAAAASLSANFPPVFSNVAVDVDEPGAERRYYVTDGGAVENRGVIEVLLALRAALAAQSPSDATADLPPIKVLVVEASAFSIPYREDRGLGAKLGAPAALADKLIAELARDVDEGYRRTTGGRAGLELVYLPMPDLLRSGAFGTHWMMPEKVRLRAPRPWYHSVRTWYRPRGTPRVTLSREQLLGLVDLLFASDAERKRSLPTEIVSWLREGQPGDPRDLLDQAFAGSSNDSD